MKEKLDGEIALDIAVLVRGSNGESGEAYGSSKLQLTRREVDELVAGYDRDLFNEFR
jgi:hypothetical protein